MNWPCRHSSTPLFSVPGRRIPMLVSLVLPAPDRERGGLIGDFHFAVHLLPFPSFLAIFLAIHLLPAMFCHPSLAIPLATPSLPCRVTWIIHLLSSPWTGLVVHAPFTSPILFNMPLFLDGGFFYSSLLSRWRILL